MTLTFTCISLRFENISIVKVLFFFRRHIWITNDLLSSVNGKPMQNLSTAASLIQTVVFPRIEIVWTQVYRTSSLVSILWMQICSRCNNAAPSTKVSRSPRQRRFATCSKHVLEAALGRDTRGAAGAPAIRAANICCLQTNVTSHQPGSSSSPPLREELDCKWRKHQDRCSHCFVPGKTTRTTLHIWFTYFRLCSFKPAQEEVFTPQSFLINLNFFLLC